MSALPSGEQHTIRHGDDEATITEVGAGLRALRLGGRDVLDGFAADEMCSGGRGQLLLPWPNRIRDGQYTFAGEERQLALTEPEQHHAIHGLTRWANWSVSEHAEDRIVLAYRLHAHPGYPCVVDLTATYALGADGLTVTTAAENVGATASPFAAGAHPYLTVGTDTVDPATLTIPAATRLLTDDRQIPTGAEPVDGTDADFRKPRTIGDTKLDTAFADLPRDDDGRARVVLAAPGGDHAVALWLGPEFPWLMVFTGDTLPQEERRRRGLGVEPMTGAPNAFASGDGLRVLEPGERFAGSWGIEATSG